MQSESHLFPHLLCFCLSPSPSLSLSLYLSLARSLSMSQLAHSPSVTYCQSAAVKFCEQGTEIAREEPCLDTSRCSNQADDPNDRESSGRKKGEEKIAGC